MTQRAGRARSVGEGSADRDRSPAEWVTFGIAAAILATIVGLVIYVWISAPAGPPALAIRRDGAIFESQGGFYVPFVVENMGGQIVEAVQVLGELRSDGEIVETGEQQIDFLSGGETASGVFVFSRPPTDETLTLRVGSYKLP